MPAGDAARILQLERELADARARLAAGCTERLLVEACPDIVLLVQPDGKVLEANDTALRLVGVERSQFVGHCCLDFFPHHVAEGRRALFAEVVQTRGPVHSIDISGNQVIDNLAVPLFDAHGEVDRLAIYARDITRQFQAEQQAREQDRLRAENEKSDALDGLASDVAHEFNNLLTPILSYLRLARQRAATNDGDDPCTLLEVALGSAERAAGLVAGVVGAQPETAPAATTPTRVPARPAGEALNVLAVDDEAGVLQVVEVALLMAGHSVQCFQTVKEGWNVFQQAPETFDAAILDQNLGDGTGVELAQRLRAASDALRIVLISGRPSSGLRRAAEVLDLRLLPKPFSVESLQGALTRD